MELIFKNIFSKIRDWYDEIYYKITNFSIKTFWINIKRWFSYYSVIRKTYDFDYTSLLEIELHQLTKLRDCIYKYQNHVDAWYDIRNMNLAINCLKIVLEDGCSYSNGEVGFFISESNERGWKELIPNPKHGYIMPVYVNTKNYKRFWKGYKSNVDSNIEPMLRDMLRIEKAWYLYNQIRKEHLREWWD